MSVHIKTKDLWLSYSICENSKQNVLVECFIQNYTQQDKQILLQLTKYKGLLLITHL